MVKMISRVVLVGAVLVGLGACRPVAVPLPDPTGGVPDHSYWCFNEPVRRHGHTVDRTECVSPAHPPAGVGR